MNLTKRSLFFVAGVGLASVILGTKEASAKIFRPNAEYYPVHASVDYTIYYRKDKKAEIFTWLNSGWTPPIAEMTSNQILVTTYPLDRLDNTSDFCVVQWRKQPAPVDIYRFYRIGMNVPGGQKVRYDRSIYRHLMGE